MAQSVAWSFAGGAPGRLPGRFPCQFLLTVVRSSCPDGGKRSFRRSSWCVVVNNPGPRLKPQLHIYDTLHVGWYKPLPVC